MDKKLEIWLPFPKSQMGQPFGANAVSAYVEDGLKGHPAIDWNGTTFGTLGYNCVDESYCYSVMNKDNPDPMRYRAVFFIKETEEGIYEISYGHCDQIYAVPGKTYRAGDLIYTVGNKGNVWQGGRYVTRAEKLNGSTDGAHLHGPQVRKLVKVEKRTGRKIIYDQNGPLKIDGHYFEVEDYENGYNGCVDPAQFFLPWIAKDAPFVLGQYGQVIALLTKIVNFFRK